ncbi:Homoserine dehydrogenase [Rhizoctonia solani]|uniref:Homoserine dehydrogenase n=1 Tax=Rhizoctonia solani TaxID=456999 RepID=A0A8H7H9V9_9AGAM|nr:Homoserine dehydrogenase [Rhizoctonia solani]
MPINVAIVGVGLVGSETISQLARLAQFRIVALSNSKKLLFNPSGIPVSSWQSELASSDSKPDLDQLTRSLAELRARGDRVALVDNTSSDAVAGLYPTFLSAGIDVVTPNKKAYSSDLGLYQRIKDASAQSGARYLNESTVGAGLPIISTLKDLIATGDKVIKIEGVLSGTLSYIFNEYSKPGGGDSAFSSIVKVAREKGYTEPHPGDDLNGADVARKLTILSRMIPELTSALPQGYKSVSITSLVPDALTDIASGDEFIARLPEFDVDQAKLRDEATKEGKVLRYAGVIDVKSGTIKAALEKYPVDHPFATALGGSDNIIAFHTERYSPRPLIVQGAGAGAAVTAMGVVSDLLKLSRELVWAAHPRARLAVGRPRSTLAASQPRGFPNLTGLGVVADADERAEDKSALLKFNRPRSYRHTQYHTSTLG